MAEIAALSTAVPSCEISAERTRTELATLLPERAMAHLPALVKGSRIRTRHAVAPFTELARLRTLEERARCFEDHAVRLGEEVARSVLERSRTKAEHVSALISVSATAVISPPLEGALIRRLRLPQT